MREQSVEAELNEAARTEVGELCDELAARTRAELRADAVPDSAISTRARVLLRYAGTDSSLPVDLDTAPAMAEAFTAEHRARYAFTMDKPLVVEAVSVEATGTAGRREPRAAEPTPRAGTKPRPRDTVRMFADGRWQDTPLHRREELRPGDTVTGPAVIAEADATTVVDPGWRAARRHRPSAAHPGPPAPGPHGRRYQGRPRHAGGLQQPLHVDRRADGGAPGEHGALRQHQGAARLLLRTLRHGRQPDRQRPAHPRPPRLDGGVHQGGPAAQRRHDASR